MDANLIQRIRDAYEHIHIGQATYFEIWKQEIVFTWRWWLSLAFVIGSWVLWFRFRKKESKDRLLMAGMVVLILSSWGDFLGVATGRWFYTSKLIPTLPSYVIYDFSIMPVEVMLLLQYKPHMSPWVKAIALAVFNAFVAEPFLEGLQIYVRLNWERYYSVSIYMIIYFVAHYVAYKWHRFEELR